MAILLPNLAQLIDRLPTGSLARELATSCAECASLEDMREALQLVIQARMQAEVDRTTDVEDQVD